MPASDLFILILALGFFGSIVFAAVRGSRP